MIVIYDGKKRKITLRNRAQMYFHDRLTNFRDKIQTNYGNKTLY